MPWEYLPSLMMMRKNKIFHDLNEIMKKLMSTPASTFLTFCINHAPISPKTKTVKPHVCSATNLTALPKKLKMAPTTLPTIAGNASTALKIENMVRIENTVMPCSRNKVRILFAKDVFFSGTFSRVCLIFATCVWRSFRFCGSISNLACFSVFKSSNLSLYNCLCSSESGIIFYFYQLFVISFDTFINLC